MDIIGAKQRLRRSRPAGAAPLFVRTLGTVLLYILAHYRIAALFKILFCLTLCVTVNVGHPYSSQSRCRVAGNCHSVRFVMPLSLRLAFSKGAATYAHRVCFRNVIFVSALAIRFMYGWHHCDVCVAACKSTGMQRWCAHERIVFARRVGCGLGRSQSSAGEQADCCSSNGRRAAAVIFRKAWLRDASTWPDTSYLISSRTSDDSSYLSRGAGGCIRKYRLFLSTYAQVSWLCSTFVAHHDAPALSRKIFTMCGGVL